MRPSIRRQVRKAAIILSIGAGAFVGLVGFAHTKPGRPLLAFLPGMGTAGCPVGADRDLTPEERDAARTAALLGARGREAAASRDALGFTLGFSRRVDVREWAARSGVACADTKTGALRCRDLPSRAVEGGADEVGFQFDGEGVVVAVDVVRRDDDAAAASALFYARRESATTRFGEPTEKLGSGASDDLGHGPLSSASAEYRFRDLRVRIDATNLGHGRFMVRERYQAIDPS
jgi:hypothetical protein